LVRRVPPLAALRRDVEPSAAVRDPWRWVVALVIAGSTAVLSGVQVGSWRRGALFAAGIGGALLVLWAASWALVRSARRWLPGGWPYLWRQGLSNLHRPSNQTVTVVLAIGFGAFLLGTLVLVQSNLLRQLRVTGGPVRPNLVLFDIQPDQLGTVRQALDSAHLRATGPVPIVPMRIASVKGRPVRQLLTDSTVNGSWALRREYRSTYRDSLVGSERLAAGRWWTSGGVPQISVESEVAGELGVGVGDEIVWDVQGVELPTRVASLREVDWARFEQTLVLLSRAEDPAIRGALQRRLAERLPNVTAIDLSLLQSALERLVDRVALAIRFMALFTLATGTLVLVGALATSRFQRVREGALLRTLGATRSQLFRIVLAEYAALGVLSALAAAVLSTGAAWALARWVFEDTFAVPTGPLAGLTLGVVVLTIVVGLANSREVIRRTPLEILRQE
jgi:putative ABC transport system permease protein